MWAHDAPPALCTQATFKSPALLGLTITIMGDHFKSCKHCKSYINVADTDFTFVMIINPYIEGLSSFTLLELRNDPLPNSTADAIEMKES